MYTSNVYIFLILIISIATISCAPAEDLAARVKLFDLPRAAPRARIISLSKALTHKSGPGDLLHDKAGSFDNFEAFEKLERNPDDNEARGPQRGQNRNLGVFFPEDEIPERHKSV